MIVVLPFAPEHAERIVPQAQQLGEISGPIAAAAAQGPSWTIVERETDAVLLVGGLAETRADYATCWAVFGEDKHRQAAGVARAVRKVVDAAGYRRLDTLVQERFDEAMRFAWWLGFEREGMMRAYFPDGGNAVMFARIREGI